eukprot:CAMPEP_0172699740 /NCGR_PEP_ID=MMETSP1074-20121228/30406_1 /TAXON_ID=2916 /ORGANISM="Ceratium fusus, Strain PA161109" /LENGTH=38 /DNA_ID= /DNA_START= /DNA_END= /DNA_ORIENTATION=
MTDKVVAQTLGASVVDVTGSAGGCVTMTVVTTDEYVGA